ncbi:MAG: hypothetical protein AAB848_01750 [Patescibacteria group bacterium]
MDGKPKGDTRMSVVEGGRDDLMEKTSDARTIFDNDVVKSLRLVASSIHRGGSVTCIDVDLGQSDESGDDLAREIFALMEDKADCIFQVRHDMSGLCLDDIDGDIWVWLERAYETPWQICISSKYNLPDKMFPSCYIFGFDSKKYLSDNKFFGVRFPEVVALLENENGGESQESKDISRVVVLTRMFIYTIVRPMEKRKKLFRELTELCVKLGPAAKAVVADFITAYTMDYDDDYDYDEDDDKEAVIGDDPTLCVGMSGCPLRSLV